MAAATMYVTPNGAGAMNGASWDNAFDLAAWAGDATSSAEAGDIYYIYDDGTTFVLPWNFDSARSGDSSNLIKVIGVSATGTPVTEATGNDRPLLSCGAFRYEVEQYWHIKNLRIFGEPASTAVIRAYSTMENCKVKNISGVAGRQAISLGGALAKAINCEAESTGGWAVYSSQNGNKVFGCYVHDSAIGILHNSDYHCDGFNIVSNCDYGLAFYPGSDFHSIKFHTVYGCGVGFSGSNSQNQMFMNNIIDSCTTGAVWDSNYGANFWDYNNWYNCTTTVVNVTTGPNNMAINPNFVDAANDNFAVQGAIINTGFPGSFPGTTSNGYCEPGAVQAQVAVSGAPTFSGITQLESVAYSCLRASWTAATATATNSTYRIYVRGNSSSSLFSSTYLLAQIPCGTTSHKFRVEADSSTYMTPSITYYVGVRAETNGTEDSNTAVLSATIDGDGSTGFVLTQSNVTVNTISGDGILRVVV